MGRLIETPSNRLRAEVGTISLDQETVQRNPASHGTQGLQAVNTMEFATRALRAWAVPYVVPVPAAHLVFDEDGEIRDEGVEGQLQLLGGEVVRVAQRFAANSALHREVECEEAAERVAAAA